MCDVWCIYLYDECIDVSVCENSVSVCCVSSYVSVCVYVSMCKRMCGCECISEHRYAVADNRKLLTKQNRAGLKLAV